MGRRAHTAVPTDEIVGRATDARTWSYSEEFTYYRQPRGEYVGKVVVDAKLTLRGRTARWVLSITHLGGPAIQRRIGWNCVDRTQVIATSCSRDWRYATEDGYHRGGWGRRASYQLEDTGKYWLDFSFSWRALTGHGREGVWVATRDFPLTTWHLRCEGRSCRLTLTARPLSSRACRPDRTHRESVAVNTSQPPASGNNTENPTGMMVIGSRGVISFTPPTDALDPSDFQGPEGMPPWAEAIRGRLPNGGEVTPTRRGHRLIWDPPLPVGTQIIVRDQHGDVQVLGEVTVPPSPPSDDTPPEWTPVDEQSPQ